MRSLGCAKKRTAHRSTPHKPPRRFQVYTAHRSAPGPCTGNHKPPRRFQVYTIPPTSPESPLCSAWGPFFTTLRCHVYGLTGLAHILDITVLEAAHERGRRRRHDHLESPLGHPPHLVRLQRLLEFAQIRACVRQQRDGKLVLAEGMRHSTRQGAASPPPPNTHTHTHTHHQHHEMDKLSEASSRHTHTMN